MVPSPLQTRESPYGDPASKNGKPYHQTVRDQVMHLLLTGQLTEARVTEIRQTQKFPSWRTCRRWKRLYFLYGHMRPCRHTGNRRSPALRGHNLVLLALYRLVCPKATKAEINAFLFRSNFGDINNRFYSHSQICRAEKRLGLTTKRSSTTAFQASEEVNVQKRLVFFHMNYPFGIANIEAADMIDLDECGIYLETANRSSGMAYCGLRVSEQGHYSRSEKWTMLLAVSGESGTVENPSRRWRNLWKEGGTTEHKFASFVEQILNDLPHGDEGRRFCFTMDNLSSHHSETVAAMIFQRGHRLAFRAPYYAVDGPIEYVFNTLQSQLRWRLYQIHNEDDLIRELGAALFRQVNFQPYFRHCGFWR